MFVCARPCVLTRWQFSFSLQMLITTGHRKVQTDTTKAYRKQRRFVYHNCELCHVTPGNALVIAVCILMLPIVRLTAEHAQLATTYGMTPTHQWHVHSHTPLVLLSLGNVLPAIVLQNSHIVRLDISASYTSSHFSICHTPFSLCLSLLSGLGRNGVMLALLLLLSGDIETNPGPVGECLF